VRHVRFGSLADITARSRHVRFTPDSGHSSVQVGCPKSANNGHLAAASCARCTCEGVPHGYAADAVYEVRQACRVLRSVVPNPPASRRGATERGAPATLPIKAPISTEERGSASVAVGLFNLYAQGSSRDFPAF
jgi:hypothetical protein